MGHLEADHAPSMLSVCMYAYVGDIGGPYIYTYAHRGLLREACAREAHDDGYETVTKQPDVLALRDLRLGRDRRG